MDRILALKEMHLSKEETGNFPPRKSVYQLLMFLYTSVLLVLPSGSIGGINVKLLLSLMVFVVVINYLSNVACATRLSITLAFLVMFFILTELWIGICNGYEAYLVFSEGKDVLITIANCWFVSVLVRGSMEIKIKYLCVIAYSEFFASTIKCALMAYSFCTGASAGAILQPVYEIFNVNFTSLDFGFMGSSLERMQFVSDSIIPICVFFVINFQKSAKIRPYKVVLMSSVFVVSAFFSYSRYIWAYTALAILLSMFLSPRKMILWGPIGIALAMCWRHLSLLNMLAQYRLAGLATWYSDLERESQKYVLEKFFMISPVLGNGLGSYPHILVRSVDLPYSYELQIFALLGQIGTLGCFFLACLLAWYYRKLICVKGKYRLALALMIIAWISSGLFNPFLISSTASVSYSAVFCLIELEMYTNRKYFKSMQYP